MLVITMPDKEKKNNVLYSTDESEIASSTISGDEQGTLHEISDNTEYIKEQEERLEKILESMRYIESAKVMITLKSSKEEVVLKNNPYVKEETKSDEVYESDEETVLIEDAKGNARPYVLKEINPQIEGIVVVISSRLDNMEQEINDVVLALFDIPVHKIKVMNMK